MDKNTLPGMNSVSEQMARSVVQAHKRINGQNTSPTGTISVHRSNGTKDIYGVLNKDGYSVAKNVGDTVAPPKPKGIFATSSSDVVYVAWDGTLEDKIPSDFYNVTIYMGVGGQSSVIGTLTEPGIVSTPPLPTAQSIEVWATAEDDTCNEDGTPAHNVSPESSHQNVTVQHGSNSQGVEELKKLIEKRVDAIEAKAEQAAETADNAQKVVEKLSNSFSHDQDGAHVGEKQGLHTTVDAQGLHVMRGDTELALFTEKLVSLAKTAKDALISLVGNTLKISAEQKTDDVGTYEIVKWQSESLKIENDKDFHVSAGRAGASISSLGYTADLGIDGTQYWLNSMKTGKSDMIGTAGPIKHLINLLTVTPWVTMQVTDGSNVTPRAYVKWRIYGGFLLFDVYVPAGYSGVHTVEKLPDKWKPSDSKYVVLATQQAKGAAGIWIDGVGGSYGDVWIYNSSSGYCSGLALVMPKAFE